MNHDDSPMQFWCPQCRDYLPLRQTFEEARCSSCSLVRGTHRLSLPKMPAHLIAPRQMKEAS